jgi:hypothetical protein
MFAFLSLMVSQDLASPCCKLMTSLLDKGSSSDLAIAFHTRVLALSLMDMVTIRLALAWSCFA